MSTPTAVTGRNLIGGEWLPPRGPRFPSHSPAHSNEVVGEFPAGAAADADAAVAAARARRGQGGRRPGAGPGQGSLSRGFTT